MRGIPAPLYERITADPDSQYCLRFYALHDHQCLGRITFEHAIIYAHQQVNEFWAITPICAWAHSVDQFQDGGGLDKEINEWIALSRIKDWNDVENKYPRNSFRQRLTYLQEKFGIYELSTY